MTASTSWSQDQFARIDGADELEIASVRRSGGLGCNRTIWVVRVEDDLYVRSLNGPDSDRYRSTRPRQQGRIHAGGVEQDVAYVDDRHETDPPLNDRIDQAYRTKYRRYSASPVERITSDEARSTTVKLVPH